MGLFPDTASHCSLWLLAVHTNSRDLITDYSELSPQCLGVSCHGWSPDVERARHRSAPLARLSRTDRQPVPSTGQRPARLYLRCRARPGPSSYHLETMFGLAPLSQVNNGLKCVIRLTDN